MRLPLALSLALALSACGGGGGPPSPPPDASGGPCAIDEDCRDALFCNGEERCDPGSASADEVGCIAGTPPCATPDACDESAATCLAGCDVPDSDGDGHAAVTCGGDDCDDADPSRFPGNAEVCDGADHDEDCDPETFGDRSVDGDPFVDAACCNVDDGGARLCGTDCDDTRANVNPETTEVCDDLDNDCDGAVDEGVQTAYYPDVDGDGFGAAGSTPVFACAPPMGTVTDATDCDDTDRSANPPASEVCRDVVDNDCDGEVDEEGLPTFWRDVDGDGFGDPSTVMMATTPTDCAPPEGFTNVGTDCDDGDPDIHPGAVEHCDGVDEDCSLPGSAAGGADPFEDRDGDGQAAVDATFCESSRPGDLPKTDCDDLSPAVRAGGRERCDGVDDDCDGATDEGEQPCGPHLSCVDAECVGGPSLSAGYHGCALHAGEVYCWGRNNVGQAGPLNGETCGSSGNLCKRTPESVPGLGDAVAVVARSRASCALRADGRVSCWGSPSFVGDGGDGTYSSCGFSACADVPVDVDGLADALTVDGPDHACAVRAGGDIHCWSGSNWAGELGGTPTTESLPLTGDQTGLDAIQVGAGEEHSCALRRDGRVVCWGSTYGGQLGGDVAVPGCVGRDPCTTTPVAVEGLTDVVQLAVGGYHACGLRADGSVWCWGDNWTGQLGDQLTTARPRAAPVVGLSGAVEVAAGASHTCVRLEDGTLECFGQNRAGALGGGETTDKRLRVPGIGDAVEVAAGIEQTCVRRSGGRITCFGRPDGGALGDGPGPQPVDFPFDELSLGGFHSCGIAGGEVWCFGGGAGLGATYMFAPLQAVQVVTGAPVRATQIASGPGSTCVIRPEGDVMCWGQINTPNPNFVTLPFSPSGLTVGTGYACAWSTTGAAACWGEGSDGQLGDGATVDRALTSPAGSPGGRLWAALSGARFSTCGIEKDTTDVYCWGRQQWGQLGNGITDGTAASPVATGLTGATSLASGGGRHCALVGGAVHCWGQNESGQVGDGTTDARTTPFQLPGLAGALSLAASDSHTCARTATETWCWGENAYGELGDGTGTRAPTPVLSVYAAGATAIRAAQNMSCALLDGVYECWGRDEERRLGRALQRDVLLP